MSTSLLGDFQICISVPLTPSRLIKRRQMVILDYVQSGNHKQSVIRTYHKDEPGKARRRRAKLSILDIFHKPLHNFQRVILK